MIKGRGEVTGKTKENVMTEEMKQDFAKKAAFLSGITGLPLTTAVFAQEFKPQSEQHYFSNETVGYRTSIDLGKGDTTYNIRQEVIFTDEDTPSKPLPSASWTVNHNNCQIYKCNKFINCTFDSNQFYDPTKRTEYLWEELNHILGGIDTQADFIDFEKYTLQSLMDRHDRSVNINLVLMTHMKAMGLPMPPIISKREDVKILMQKGKVLELEDLLRGFLVLEGASLDERCQVYMNSEAAGILKIAQWEKDKKDPTISLQSEGKSVQLLPNIINVVSMSDDERSTLRQRIKSFDGKIRIFIHPFYEENRNGVCFSEHKELGLYPYIDIIKTGMTRILSKKSKNTPPVFIFEELDKIEETAKKIAKMNKESGNTTYFVPTQNNSSEPKFTNENVFDAGHYEETWKKVVEFFKGIETRKILIGGMRLTIEYTGQPGKELKGTMLNEICFSRCVGSAIELLAKSFEIEVSNLTHPHNRLDLLNITVNGLGSSYTASSEYLCYLLEYGLTGFKTNPFQIRKKAYNK